MTLGIGVLKAIFREFSRYIYVIHLHQTGSFNAHSAFYHEKRWHLGKSVLTAIKTETKRFREHNATNIQ
jgi:hypothetical protein